MSNETNSTVYTRKSAEGSAKVKKVQGKNL